MNYSLVCLFCLAFAAASASVLPLKRSPLPAVNEHGDELNDKCDLDSVCIEVEVCGYNGQCLQKFSNPCAMASYNCRNPQKTFIAVEDSRCTQVSQPLCSKEDRKELKLTL